MSDRTRTPSPHKQSRVEPGIFSSISSFPLYKSGLEGKSSAVKSSLVLPSRPKSPVKPSTTVSPARGKAGLRTPERNRSPAGGRATTTHSADMGQPMLRTGEEIAKLQEKVQKLTAQLSNERKLSSALEQKCWTEAALHKEEQAKLRADLSTVQQNLQKWRSQVTDQSQTEISSLKATIDACRSQTKAVIGVFVSLLEELMVNSFYSDELVIDPVEEERLLCLEGIQKQVLARLEGLAACTGCDLGSEIGSVQSWVPQVTAQPGKATGGKGKRLAEEMPFAQGEKQFPQLSYSVEFFTDELQAAQGDLGEGEGARALHPLNPLRTLEENRVKPAVTETQEGDELKQRIINRIKARESSRPIARALYDYVGEMVHAR